MKYILSHVLVIFIFISKKAWFQFFVLFSCYKTKLGNYILNTFVNYMQQKI